MRWTLGLLLLAVAGCGASQTKMVACPSSGCPDSYASSSPEGTRYTPPPMARPAPAQEAMAPAAPVEPPPEVTPTPPDLPAPTPTP